MEKELFGSIRDNYYEASDELWFWFRNSHILLKIVFFLWIVLASATMRIAGFIFSLGIILDKISVWLQSKRTLVIDKIEDVSDSLYYKKSSYLFSPLLGFLLFPVALLLGIIPKWSTTLVVGIHPDLDIGSSLEHGYFIQLGKKYLKLSKSLIVNIKEHGFFFGIIALFIALITAPITLIMSLIFFLLIILDLFGWVVSLIRKFVVSSSQAMASKSGDNAMYTIIMPALLTIFVPVYIFLLLIPKIATHEMST